MVTTNLTVCFNTSSCWQKDGDIYINLVVIAAVFFCQRGEHAIFPLYRQELIISRPVPKNLTLI